MFGLFSRKSTRDTSTSLGNDQNSRLPTPTPSVGSVARHSPFRFPTTLRSALGGSTTDLTLKDSDQATESVAEGGNNDHPPAPPPPATPTPPSLVNPNETKTLYDLVLTIPPKTLHAYTLAHLRPQPPPPSPSPALESYPDNTPRPSSPNTVTKLAAFFSTLAPPPLLHCIRCHKDFYDIENEEKDKACRVPHDDESALVSRVSGGGYETLWGCCGQTAPGDGGEGPPDGWCYEGRHTTDAKRARFRADSTMHDGKLTSCLKLNCRGIRDAHASPSRNVGTSSARKSNPSPARSHASVLIHRSARKRPRKSSKGSSGSDNEADGESLATRAAGAKGIARGGGGAGERGEGTNMVVDEPIRPPKSKAKAKATSQPIFRARPPASTSTTGFGSGYVAPVTRSPAKARTTTLAKPNSTPRARPPASTSTTGSGSNVSYVVPVTRSSAKARTTALVKRRSTSPTLPVQSHTYLTSDSDASIRSRPRTRSYVREESRGRADPKLTRADISDWAGRAKKTAKLRSRSPTSDGEESRAKKDDESDREERGRDRKKRRVQD